jgi:hypothetical protein
MRLDSLRLAMLAIALVGACSSSSSPARGYEWGRKDSWRQCSAAIRGYPKEPLPPCRALSMCANEAPLTEAEDQRLTEMNTAGGCAPF